VREKKREIERSKIQQDGDGDDLDIVGRKSKK
jgi:hypothetical protein